MNVKTLQKEIENLIEKSQKGAADFNEIMKNAVTKYNLSADLVIGWLNAYLESNVEFIKINADEFLLVEITPNTPSSIPKALKSIIDNRGLSGRIIFVPDEPTVKTLKMNDKDALQKYIDYLQKIVDSE